MARASKAVSCYLARGVTAIRAHVDTVPTMGLKGVEAAVEVQRGFEGRVDLQIVAGCFIPATGLAGASNLARLRDALGAGATFVGGFPSLDPDPAGAVEALADLAAEHRVGLDLHIDETTNPDMFALGRLIEIASAGFPHRVNASHAVSLGSQAPERQRVVADSMAESGVTVVTLPQTNLLLQGRGAGSFAPRGLTALRPLLDAGVHLGAGGDNIQDAFNPLGRADPFETAAPRRCRAPHRSRGARCRQLRRRTGARTARPGGAAGRRSRGLRGGPGSQPCRGGGRGPARSAHHPQRRRPRAYRNAHRAGGTVRVTAMTSSCSFADLRASEVPRRLSESSALVQPIAAIEQHGPHLPPEQDAAERGRKPRKTENRPVELPA